jgi:MFS family permease
MNNNNNTSAYPNPVYAWYVVTILFLAYTVSYIDRQIMALLVEPIKQDLNISDTQISLLQGFAFTIFYTVAGVPLGRLADQKNRRRIISVGIFVWSFMTAACGLARNFTFLFLARIGVGVGEACLSPAAYSIIADYFPKHKRGMPISLYSMGIFFGAGLSFIISGYVIQEVSAAQEIILPVIGLVRPWQLTFFIVGIPGLLLVALLYTVKEPVRHDLLTTRSDGSQIKQHLSIRETIAFLLSHKTAYGAVFFGFAFKATLSYGYFAWIPSMFVRTYGWDVSRIGYLFGLIIGILGTSGIVLGGILADRGISKGIYDSHMRVSIYAALGVLVFGVSAMFMPDPVFALLFLCPTAICLGIPVGLAAAAVNFITPNQMRGQAIAVYIFFAALIGMTCGPTVIALITDYVFRDPLAVRYSIAIFTVIFALLASAIFVLGLKPYRTSATVILAEETG